MWYDFNSCRLKIQYIPRNMHTVFCFAVLCCGYTLTDFPISIRLTSLALWQSNDCPSASKATLMNMDKYFMWIHYERLHNHNKAKHNKTVCIFLGIYCNLHHNTYDIIDGISNELILGFELFSRLTWVQPIKIECISISVIIIAQSLRKKIHFSISHESDGIQSPLLRWNSCNDMFRSSWVLLWIFQLLLEI